MENLEISQVENRKMATGATGFDIFDEGDTFSETDDHLNIDNI